MQQHKVFRNNAFDRIGNENLIAVKLNLVLVYIKVRLQFREVEDTCQVERVIDVQVNVEQRFLEVHRVEFVVELHVVFVLEVGRFLLPSWVGVVYDVVLVGFLLLAVFPFLFLSENDWYWQEFAVFIKHFFDSVLFEEFFRFAVDVQDDVGTDFGLFSFFESVFGVAVALPANSLSAIAVRFCDDFDLFGNHKRRVETKAEMSDYGICDVLVLVEEVACTRKCNLVDVLVNFFGGHTYAVVADGDGLCVLVNRYLYFDVVGISFVFARLRQGFKFLTCIYCV